MVYMAIPFPVSVREQDLSANSREIVRQLQDGSINLNVSTYSGTWHGATITAAVGGTGLTAYASGDLLYGSGGNILAKLAIGAQGQLVQVLGGLPTWATFSGSTDIRTLGVVTAGTWNATAISAVYGGTGQTTVNSGDIFYASGGSIVNRLAAGTANQLLKISSGLPAWATYTGSTDVVTLGTITTGVWNGTDIAVADGGTGSSTAAGARSNLSAAVTGANGDITSLTALTGVIEWSSGAGITSTNYQITRNADGTNQLQFNVPTGAGFEFSVNDVARVTLVATVMTVSSNVTHSRADVGDDVTYLLRNTDNTNGASRARFQMVVGGATAGDTIIQMGVSGVTDWGLGIDNSDTDAFVISESITLGTSNRLKIATGGVVTIPNLAGTGSRTVVADANGVLSAP